MKTKDRKPVSKTKLLALIKDLDWRSVRAAVEENPNLLEHRGEKGQNLLHLCCGIDIAKRGLTAAASIKTAAALLDAPLDVNQEAFTEGDWKARPLWYAIGHGKNLELAKYLLRRGATPEHCMWAAAYNDSAAAIRLLVGAGAAVETPGRETPFLFAVKWSRFESAKALLEAGADANAQDRFGETALHCLLKKRSQPRYIQMLLRHGARLDLKNRKGMTAGSILSRMRTPEYRNFLRK